MKHHAGLHVTGFDTTDGHGADTADRVDILESGTTNSQRVSTELAVVVTPPAVHAPRRVRSILLLAGKSDVEDMREFSIIADVELRVCSGTDLAVPSQHKKIIESRRMHSR